MWPVTLWGMALSFEDQDPYVHAVDPSGPACAAAAGLQVGGVNVNLQFAYLHFVYLFVRRPLPFSMCGNCLHGNCKNWHLSLSSPSLSRHLGWRVPVFCEWSERSQCVPHWRSSHYPHGMINRLPSDFYWERQIATFNVTHGHILDIDIIVIIHQRFACNVIFLCNVMIIMWT